MMPGRMNPRQMQHMMKRLGINVKEIENVEKIIIRTDTKEYIFDEAEVTIMDAQGQKTYQISGRPKIILRKAQKEEETIPHEDIDLVAKQTGKSKAEAKKALVETKGDIAEAILKLTS
ncbi:MAG: nascent polypeptide-associated complex protein [Thermoplasmatales archaeon]|jgi:nascent polypeptide-associated complex subunit alpha|nr:MAG: nascent polypeptide-associated complex protein [Thermoplasmatales archaeon]